MISPRVSQKPPVRRAAKPRLVRDLLLVLAGFYLEKTQVLPYLRAFLDGLFGPL